MASEHNPNSSDRLPQVATEYIETVVKRMRYRRARRDVRAELHAHFDDALAEGRSDRERQEMAEQLVEAFGDTRLLAQLIRRAKKRCRPLWQKMVLRTAQVCGIFVLYVMICTIRLYVGEPVIKTDMIDWLNQAVSEGRSEDLNARSGIEEAVAQLPDRPRNLPRHNIEDMNEFERDVLTTYLDDCQPALRLLRQAVEKPHYWGHYMAMKYQIQWECEQKKGDQALSDSLVLTRLGRHLSGTGLMNEGLVGIAVAGLGVGEMSRVLSEIDLDRDGLASAYQGFVALLKIDRPWFTFEYEKALYYDSIQYGFTDDGHGNGRPLAEGALLVAAESPLDWYRDLLLFDYPDRRATTERIDTFYGTMDRMANQLTPWDQKNKGRSPPEPVGIFLEINRPAYERAGQINWRMRTHFQATLAILAIRLYEKTYGTLPADLGELVTVGLLEALPKDYYSDGPLAYRRSGEGFILYSRGEDLVDDGGSQATNDKGEPRRYAPTGDWIFWPLPERGR